MKHGSLFSGIGGFDLAAEWMGWHNVFHCEINDFGRKVLNHYWPNADSLEDITKTDFTKYAGTVDIISGGFPCQPYSAAGKRLGKDDDRHLWPEMLRAIREIQPRWVVGENVLGLVNWNGGLVFEEVQADLEAEGYQVQAYVLPAAGVNAPHRRDRVWFVAYSDNSRADKQMRNNGERKEENNKWSRKSQSEFRENCVDGFIENTNKNGWRGDKWQEESQIRKQRHTCSGNNERISAYNDKTRITTDTESGWQGRIRNESKEAGSRESHKPLGSICGVSHQNATDTNYTGLEGSEVNGGTRKIRQKSHKQFTRFIQSAWQNFPTQSPICGGDDGLPTKLHGITFSKWRNESIKAYGNAIVPQVVYQIFKAIEEYEITLRTPRLPA